MTSQQPPEGLSAELDMIASELRRWSLKSAPDGFRLFRDEARVEGPWAFAEADLAQQRMSEVQAAAVQIIVDAARSTSPAPDPKAGEREQVAEAVERAIERLKRDAHSLADLRTVVAALAEARSEVERVTGEVEQTRFLITGGEDAPGHTMTLPFSEIERVASENLASHHAEIDRAEAAEAERDTLAAQLVGAREALENALKTIGSAEGCSQLQFEIDDCLPDERRALERELRAEKKAVRDGIAAIRQALSMSILRGDKGPEANSQ